MRAATSAAWSSKRQGNEAGAEASNQGEVHVAVGFRAAVGSEVQLRQDDRAGREFGRVCDLEAGKDRRIRPSQIMDPDV